MRSTAFKRASSSCGWAIHGASALRRLFPVVLRDFANCLGGRPGTCIVALMPVTPL